MGQPSPNERQPWHRQPGEPSTWFNRFKAYLRQKSPRSVTALYDEERAANDKAKGLPHTEQNTYPHAWHNALNTWQWRERAAQYDAWNQDRIERQWQDRRDQERELEWDVSREMYERARTMLKMPVARSVIEDGKTIIEPASPAYHRAAATLIKEARDTARLAAGLVTSKSSLTLESLPDEELIALWKSLNDPSAPTDDASSQPAD
jgi:hypothetical protein